MSFLSPALFALSLVSSLGRASPLQGPQSRSSTGPSAQDGSKDVIVQMFGWSWDSIASECTDFLGPAGYAYVQVSPAQEHVSGKQWWTDYQPVSYTLTSKRGDRAQYQNMINTCHTAGVKVIADTIFNHMTGTDSGTGVAGSTFSHYVYPGIYEVQDFHYCGLTDDNNIADWDSEEQVWTCELDNLADLATDTEYVRSRLAEYANDLLSLGVDGLRLDAAKDITQEVIAGATLDWPSMYVGNGDVQEFRFTYAVKKAFSGSGISNLEDLDGKGWINGSQANVFVTNHDTERSGDSLNYNSASNTYTTALIFSLAASYGNTVTILSSYEFSGYDDGAPNNGTGTCSGTGGSGGWLCQHRWVAITGMVGFRSKVGTEAMNSWVSPQSEQIAFGRGSIGFVAINNADEDWTSTFTTSLPDGTYCDVITGTSSSGSCTGTSFTVSGGSLHATVPSRSAIAVHSDAII